MVGDTAKCHPMGEIWPRATLLLRGDILLCLPTCKDAIYYITMKVLMKPIFTFVVNVYLNVDK